MSVSKNDDINISIYEDIPQEARRRSIIADVECCDKEALERQVHVDDDDRQGTMTGSIANIINTAIGAGVLSIPFAVSTIGWVLGVIILALCAAASWYSVSLLNAVIQKMNMPNNTFGEPAKQLKYGFGITADSFLAFFYLIVATMYLNIAASFFRDGFVFLAPQGADDWYFSRTFLLTLFTCVVAGPLAYLRKATVLQYTSSAAVLCIFYTVILTIVYAASPLDTVCARFLSDHNQTTCPDDVHCAIGDDQCKGDVHAAIWDFSNIIKAIPIFITSFTCQPQIFMIYNDMKNATARRMNIAAVAALSVCALVYMIIGIAGYSTYGSALPSDLLSAYPMNIEVTVARFGIGFVVLVSYPLLVHPARDGVLKYAYELSHQPEKSRNGKIIYYSITTFFIGFTYLIAMLNISLGTMLEVAGSLATANCIFTFPAIYYWYFMKEKGRSAKRMSAIAVGIFGISICILNVVLWFV